MACILLYICLINNICSIIMAKTNELKNFDFGASSDPGLIRKENEDCMGYFESINGYVFVVCDGLGAHVGGAVASQTAVESIRAYLENHYFDMPEDALKAAIEFANSVVLRKARENPSLSGMATTIAMIIIRQNKVYYAHVGDSRIYIYSGDKIHRLTQDHSYVQSLIDKGEITEQEAMVHPEKNIITRALGLQTNIEATIAASPVLPANGDIIVLCTDGLNGMLTDTEIEEVLGQDETVQLKAIRLTQFANNKGGTDNTTVQLILFFNVANRKSKFVDMKGQTIEMKPDKKEIVVETPETEIPLQPKEKKRVNLGNIFHLSHSWKGRVKMIVIALGVIILGYIFWDLFFKGSSGPEMLGDGKTVIDTLKKSEKDTPNVAEKTSDKAPDKVIDKPKDVPAGKTDTAWFDYTVAKGDLLGKIAIRFGVPVVVIQKSNFLTSDNIDVGQELSLPVKAIYTIASNDNMSAIASKYKVDKQAILRANEMKDEKKIKAGQKLIIPFK